MPSEPTTEASSSEALTHEELDQKYFLPLGIQETFYRVYHIFLAQWGLFLAINTSSLLLTYAVGIPALLLTHFLLDGMTKDDEELVEDNDDDWEIYYSSYYNRGPSKLEATVCAIVAIAIFYLFQAIADGANIRAVAELYAGRNPNILDCVKESGRKILSLLGAGILVGISVVIPLGFLIWFAFGLHPSAALWAFLCLTFAVYCLFVVVYTFLMYPAVIVESRGPLQSCFRSLEHSQGHRLYIFFTLVLFVLLRVAVNAVVSSLTSSRYHYGPSYYYYDTDDYTYLDLNLDGTADGPLMMVFFMLFAALGSILQAVVFVNIGVMKDGMTAKNLSEQLGLPNAEGDNYEMIADKKENVAV